MIKNHIIVKSISTQANLPRFRPRKERPARTHISTLHIWPARRPLAASRAALLPDPGRRDERGKLLAQMAGQVMEARGWRGACEVPGGGPGGVQGAGAAGAGPVRGRRGDSAGSDAARVRGGGSGHQPHAHGVVHPALHGSTIRACWPGEASAGGRAVRRMRSSSRCGARGAGGSLRPFRCRRCATPASAAEAARNGRGRPSVGGFAQRGIRSLPSGERGEFVLGGEAGE